MPKFGLMIATVSALLCGCGQQRAASSGLEAAAVAPAVASPEDGRYMVVFGYEDGDNDAPQSHTFATFVDVRDGTVQQQLTISWLPAPGYFGDNGGVPPLATVPGHNYSLAETLAFARGHQLRFRGPLKINNELWQRVQARVGFLGRGRTDYKMFVLGEASLRQPALSNHDGGAINCIMAVSDLGGFLDTGTAFGFDASEQVLSFLSRYVEQDLDDRAVAGLLRLSSLGASPEL